MPRAYESSHPWITFQATNINAIGHAFWMLVGEAKSKCDHLAGTPLKPEVALQLALVTLVKGVHATTAIEGNTLTEQQVQGILDGSYKAPPSRQYQEQEVRNVLDALTDLDEAVMRGERIRLTPELIKDFNKRILKGLEDQLEPGVVPGEIRKHSVGVFRYRGAPPEDCEYLVKRMCDWLEGSDFRSDDPQVQFALLLAQAVLAHLYLAWIHPFGDGNGRTARLVEFLILARSGCIPLPAAHLLSNHYNLTRDRYYAELDKASRSGGEIRSFLAYAVQGFVDGIREEIRQVSEQQFIVSWINYVHDTMGRLPQTKATHRQRTLVLAMRHDAAHLRSDLPGLTPKLAAMYATAGPRTLSRDLNQLTRVGLIRRVGGRRYEANTWKLAAFLPPMAMPLDELPFDGENDGCESPED